MERERTEKQVEERERGERYREEREKGKRKREQRERERVDNGKIGKRKGKRLIETYTKREIESKG